MASKKTAARSADTLDNGDPRPVGLFAKMAYVMGQVQHVPKNGENTHFRYKYVREVDLTEHLRPLMSELGLLCIPSQTSDVLHVDGEKKSDHVMYVRHEFTWVDADSGEQHVQSVWGAGQDGQDKGPYKALTGAVKYALMKTLLVPTGDDPEATDGEGNSTGTPPRREEPTRAPAKKARKKAEQKVEQRVEEPSEEERLLEEQVATAQAAIGEACETLDQMVEDGAELEEGELANKDAAAQLLATDMEDRVRYLKALTRAQEYLEKLAEAYSSDEDEEEE